MAAVVFLTAGGMSTGVLMSIRHHAVDRAHKGDVERERRRGQRDRFACVWGRDFDAAKLEDTTRTAAEAVGLRMTDLQVDATPGAIPGQSRILSLEVDATGRFETAMGFLRLAVFEKPALEVESLTFTASGAGLVDMKLRARAECGF